MLLALSPITPAVGAASPAAEQAADLEEQLPALTGVERLHALVRLSEAYRRVQPKKAISFGTEAVALLASHPAPEEEVRLFLSLAHAIHFEADLDGELRWAEKARHAAQEQADDEGLWQALTLIADVHRRRGKYRTAVEHLRQARLIVERLGDPSALSIVLDAFGRSYGSQGRYSRALEVHLEALEIQRNLDDPVRLAMILNSTANVYGQTGSHEQALSFYEEALQIRKRLGHQWSVAATLMNIAVEQSNLDRHEDAAATSRLALDIAESIDRRNVVPGLLNNIAVDLERLGRLEEAVVYVERAEEAARASGGDAWMAVILATVGEVMTSAGRYDRALAALNESYDLVEKNEMRGVAPEVLQIYADTY
ncbi:MAG: tetratricopeptide repeat protein, partial [bacterium]|nr:tetratricopeptide repeat protein [bacterium]